MQQYPLLHQRGAYHSSAVYTAKMLGALIQHASFRGIIVVPEIDGPSHSQSWSLGYPNLTAHCPGYDPNVWYVTVTCAANRRRQLKKSSFFTCCFASR